MLTPLGLTLKHVQEDGEVFYIAAHYIRHIRPTDGRPSYALFDAGDRLESGTGSREITRGTVYILNSAGKTIDTLRLGEVGPFASAPPAEAA